MPHLSRNDGTASDFTTRDHACGRFDRRTIGAMTGLQQPLWSEGAEEPHSRRRRLSRGRGALAGCRDEADAPTVTMDASLRPLLVTRSDFPSGWQVQDLSDEMSKNSGGTESGRAEPAQCDASDKTSLSSGVVAMVTKTSRRCPTSS